jgi:CheY-like chemotaxis protein
MGVMTAEHEQAPILVVEDDRDTRAVMKILLELEGYSVETAANGAEALGKLRAGLKPCLILLDLMMPGMDGFQFMNEKRHDRTLSPIPVIIASGMYDAKQNAAHLRAQDYLQKPVERERLLRVVGTHRQPPHLRLVRGGAAK